MARTDPAPALIASRLLAAGDGWRVLDVTCQAGPADRPFEEQHGWTSIAAVLRGIFTYRGHRGRALMAPGALLLGDAGTCFACGHEHGSGDRCIAFQFAPGFAGEHEAAPSGTAGTGFRHAAIPPLDSMLPLLARARALAAAPDTLHAEQLALDMARAAIALDGDQGETRHDAREAARAARAARFIQAHYAEPLSIAALARDAGLGPRRFAGVFRNVIGMTPYSYILHRRLDEAAARLRAGGKSVLQVALDTGFSDLSEFTRRFRARFGQPPARYRRGLARHGAGAHNEPQRKGTAP